MSEPLLSVVVPCKGRLHHLKLTAPALLAQPEVEYILVDYSCPDRCGDYARQHWPRAKVVDVPGEKYFNLSRARNIGVREAKAPWLAILDADNVVSPDFAQRVLTLLHDESVLLRSEQNSGTLVCRRKAFHQAGGYEESFEGWGSEDCDLTRRLLLGGRRQVRLPRDIIGVLHHDDNERVRFYREKNLTDSDLANKSRAPFRLELDLYRPWPDPVILGVLGPCFAELWRSVQYGCFVQRVHRVQVQLYTRWHGRPDAPDIGEPIDLRPRLAEIFASLAAPRPLPLIDDVPLQDVHWPFWPTPLQFAKLPTRLTWRGWTVGSRRRIAFQMESAEAPESSVPAAERARILAPLPSCEFVRVDPADGVARCLEAVAHCDLFIGIDSGMAQLCYAAGVPVFLLHAPQNEPDEQLTFLNRHGNEPAILCRNGTELRSRIAAFLGLTRAEERLL
jgi:hypothetical protein